MRGQGFLEKLLDGAAVEWKSLEDVTLPTRNIKWAETDRTYRYIDLTSVDRETGEISEAKEITADTAPSRAQKLVETDDLIFATTRPAQQRFCLIAPDWSGEVASTGYCVLRPDQSQVLPGWLLHWIGSAKFKAYVEEHQTGSAYPAISDARVKAFEIPIPCPNDAERSLAIQREIVRILDSFNELTAELTAELEARKKQYNHYRDRLLTFEDDEIEWKTLGDGDFFEIANNGRRPIKASLREPGGTPYYGANNIQDYVAGYTHEGEYVLIAEDGSVSLENYSIQYTTGRFWANNHVHVVRGTRKLNTRYLFYLLNVTNFQPFLSGGVRAKLTKGRLIEIAIPIPCPDDQERSLAIQRAIVRSLDQFDTLTTSLSEGLPCEIALRQQQYEYYRDLLLNFPKQAEAVEA